MKKLVAFAAVIAAVSFASCGNKSAESAETVVETEKVVVEEAPVAVNDSVASAASDSVAVQSADSAAVEAAPAE